MPNPSPGALHVDSLLTDFSVAYLQDANKFVADRVFPRVGVAKQSDRYATYSQADFNRDEVQRRAAGSAAVRVGYDVDNSNSYLCEEFAVEHAIDDQVRANASGPYNPEQDAVKLLVQKMLIRREKQFVTKFLSTGNIWTGSSDGADVVGGTDFTRWSNAASSPIEDIHNQCARVESKTGFMPNKLVVNRQIWFDLKNHPDIVDRVKYVSAAPVDTGAVASLMGLDDILVAAGVENQAVEGMAHSGAYIAGDKALLVYAPSSPGLMSVSGGYTFVWNGLLGSNEGQVVEMYREDRTHSDIISVRATWDQKVIASAVGVLFSDCSTRQ
jgi:hypothetical protein